MRDSTPMTRSALTCPGSWRSSPGPPDEIIVISGISGRWAVRCVDDIISSGEERPPGGWRRRLLLTGVLVAVAALVIVEHLPRDNPGAHPGGGPGTAGRHVGQRSFPVRLRVEGPAMLPPSGIVGSTNAWDANARLPRAGAHPVWFWPAQDRVAPIRGLPPDRFGYVFIRVGGGWAIQPAPGPTGCGGCAGPLTPVFYLADRAQMAVMVGSASQVAPAAAGGQMWLTTYPPRLASDLDRTPGVAQRYDGSGARIGAPVTLPAGYGITQGTLRGLLLESLGQGGQDNSDRLWNPATGKVLRNFDGVVAVNATAVAYAPPCAATCSVNVFNVRSGRDVTVKMRPTDTVMSGVFSSDGRFLALQIGRGNGDVGDGGASAIEFEVWSAATGRVMVVPRIFVSSDALAAFGWPGGRDDLVAEFSVDGAVQMASWDPAARRLAVADIARNQDPAALVVG